ncbi:MAG: hypothetical protein WDN46_17360 [Methylocella sp.]
MSPFVPTSAALGILNGPIDSFDLSLQKIRSDRDLLSGEIRSLREQLAEAHRSLEANLHSTKEIYDGSFVRTIGMCLPARGRVLSSIEDFAWVIFDGCDEPRTWPLKYLRSAE